MNKFKLFCIFSLLIILIISSYFRLSNLGYSEFQGDETSVQNFLFHENTFANFLLTRTVGPGQYIVAYASNLIFLDNNPEFFIRLPFAIIGIITTIYLFYVVSKFLDPSTALTASFFAATSGLLIAFSRFVQYQSFILLISVISISTFYAYLKNKKNIYLFTSALLSGIGLLFHYDSLSFILPITLIMTIIKDFKGLAKYITAVILISLIFYIPFSMQPQFKETWGYLIKDRVSSNSSKDNVYKTVKLMQIYHPKEFTAFLGIGLLMWLYTKIKGKSLWFHILSALLLALTILRAINPQKNEIYFYLSLILFTIWFIKLLFALSHKKKLLFTDVIEIWFFFVFGTYVLLFSNSLTHFYTILIPAFILSSNHISRIYTKGKLVYAVLFIVFAASSISYANEAFINTTPEFPWNQKRYIGGKMPEEISKGTSIDGIFGFPYKRDWRKIAEIISSQVCENHRCWYKSNEKYRLSKYYIRGHRWVEADWDIFVFINKPQSLNNLYRPKSQVPIIESEGYTIYKAYTCEI